MSNVIRFLESLGRDVGAGALASDAFAAVAAEMHLEADVRAALGAGDLSAVAQMIGARSNMMMFLAPTEPDNEKPDEEAPESELRSAA